MNATAKNQAAGKHRSRKHNDKAANTGAKARRASADKATKAVTAADPEPAAIVQKREFLARVAAAAGVSRAQVRGVVEATLDQLGQAIANGETLALPPFGRARVARQRDTRGGEVIVVKLRRAAKDIASNE